MPNAGPLTAADLLALWKSSTDPSYHLPLLQAGDGQGLETITQLCEVFARVSQAIDRTTQELFILPFSGQTSESASGPRLSTVTLRITRAAAFLNALTFVPGTNAVGEETTDASLEGPVVVLTGRRYVLVEYASLPPGEDEIEVFAVAERPGRGYDNPLPGTIRRFVQPASGFENTGATLTPGPDAHVLNVGTVPDVLIPEHAGRYLSFITGANQGRVRRIVSVEQLSDLSISAKLAPTGVYSLSLLAGDFIPGENVEQWPSGALGTALYADAVSMTMSIDRTNSINIATGQVVVGLTSGAQAVIDSESISPDMTAETSAHWRVLDWETDLGLSVTNDESPTGGRIGLLDALGKERKVARVQGEDDISYARRVATPADVVSPGAVLRAANRVLAPYGFRACLREVGTSKLTGLFFDGDPSSDPAIAFAYDLDFDVRPADRFKLALDLLEFRGFFLIGVPRNGFGDFGIAFDVGPWNAYDASPYLAFYDGFPLSAASIAADVWQAVDRVRAAGVGFDLYLEDRNCTP